jgi:SAM-dependent methyltransferase
MTEFWEENFKDKNEMWGMLSSESAVMAKDLFEKMGFKNILIPGIGYGRNASPFLRAGMDVQGIEISQTAIDLAQKHFDNLLKIYHGSVTDMPFNEEKYDGIFCYALIHLLDEDERKKLLNDCYDQLKDGGYMIFTTITKDAPTYGKGKLISKDRYEIHEGAKIYFYDREVINNDFEAFGLIDIVEVVENFPFYMIICRK